MSVSQSTRAWSLKVTASQKLVLLAIADWANDGGVAYPGTSSLEEKTGLSRRAIFTARKELREQGYLTWGEAANDRSEYGTNVYRLHLPEAAEGSLNRRKRSHATSAPGAPVHDTHQCTTCTGGGAPGAPNTSVDTSVTTPPTPTTEPDVPAAPSLPGVPPPSGERPGEIVKEIFETWLVERRKNGNTRLTEARQRAVRAALKAGYTREEILDAIRGVARDQWQDRVKHDDLTVILRINGSQNNLERFRDLHRAVTAAPARNRPTEPPLQFRRNRPTEPPLTPRATA